MKVDKHLFKLDGCMRALAMLRLCYDPLFDDNTPYSIVAATTADSELSIKHLDWLNDMRQKLNDTIALLEVKSGMLVDARDLLESIREIAEGTDKTPDEVFAWWTNRSKPSPSPTVDPPQSS